MAKDPAVLFYTSDFLTGTSFFTMEQRGQYITLLCQQHQLGLIPKNHMISICKSLDSPVVKKFMMDRDGNYYNTRMKEEAERRRMFCESRSNNLSGRKKNKSYKNSNDNHMGNHMETETETENRIKDKINIAFEKFWNLYDKKIDRPKSESKWNKLTDNERADIMEYIPLYIKSQPDKQYRKNPVTFLNNKSWNNEIIEGEKYSFKNQDDSKVYPGVFKKRKKEDAKSIKEIINNKINKS